MLFSGHTSVSPEIILAIPVHSPEKVQPITDSLESIGILKASVKVIFGWIRRLDRVVGRVGAPATEVSVLVQAMLSSSKAQSTRNGESVKELVAAQSAPGTGLRA